MPKGCKAARSLVLLPVPPVFDVRRSRGLVVDFWKIQMSVDPNVIKLSLSLSVCLSVCLSLCIGECINKIAFIIVLSYLTFRFGRPQTESHYHDEDSKAELGL